jgi:hypothetical protein
MASNFLAARDDDAGPVVAVAGTYDNTVVGTSECWKFKIAPVVTRHRLRKRIEYEAGPRARQTGMERAKGIEPSYAAWEAAVLPLNYARGIL